MRRAAENASSRDENGAAGGAHRSVATPIAPDESAVAPGARRASATRAPDARAASAAMAPARPPHDEDVGAEHLGRPLARGLPHNRPTP